MTSGLRELLERVRGRMGFLCADAEARENAPLSPPEEAFAFLAEAFHVVSATGMAGAAQKNNYVKELAARSVDVLSDPSLGNHVRFQSTLFSGYRDLFAQAFPVQGASRDLVPLYLRKYLQILDEMAQIGALPPGARRGPEVERALSEALTFFLNNWTGALTIVRPGARTLDGPEMETLPGSAPAVSRVKSLSRQIREGLYLVSETVPPLSLHPFFYLEEGRPYVFRMLTSDGAFYRELGRGGYSLLLSTSLIMDLGDWLFRCGAYAKAMGLYRLAGGKSREAALFVSALNHCLNAQEHSSRGEAARATGEWELALAVKPEYPVLYHELANDCLGANRPQQAVSVLNRLLERYPVSDEAYVALGDVYASKNDWGRAQRAYEKAVILNPHHPTAADKRQASRVKLEAKGTGEPEKPAGTLPDDLLSSLTSQVMARRHDPLLGREEALAQLMESLSCRDKRNVLLVGEPGVGKTALVEELAWVLQGERSPEGLRGRRIASLSLATLIAGARFRGQFEERVLELVRKIKEKGDLLFVENLHQLVHSGSSKGASLDSAALLKPSLTRGDIQVIGTTDEEALSNILEKEPAFLKHFHVLRLEELPFEEVRAVVRQRKSSYEEFHVVSLPADLFENSLDLVRMSITSRCLPESALDLMDRTAARVSLRRAPDSPERPAATRDDMLLTLSEMSGIAYERLSMLNRERLAGLDRELSAKVVGQEAAVHAVSRVVRAAKLGLDLNPHRPDGVFLFVGPTGVGKTELARRLAELLFGDDEKLIRIDMSEYMERISTSRLIGTAPGYVGYYDQNQLTDKVRRNPYCVILFDEVEKADPQVLNLFLQIFDAGRLTDGKGRTVRFHHATVIMTSNVGTKLFSKGRLGYQEPGEGSVENEAVLREVRANFTPEFLNRVDEVIVFRSLEGDSMEAIVDLQLEDLRERLAHQGKQLLLEPAARAVLAREGYSPDYGARNVGRTLRRLVSEPMAELALRADWPQATAVRLFEKQGSVAVELVLPAYDFSLQETAADEESPHEEHHRT